MPRSTIIGLGVLAGLAACAWYGQARAQKARQRVTVLYTVNNQGYIEPCG